MKEKLHRIFVSHSDQLIQTFGHQTRWIQFTTRPGFHSANVSIKSLLNPELIAGERRGEE